MSKIRIYNPLYIKTVPPPYKSKHTDESTKKPKDNTQKKKLTRIFPQLKKSKMKKEF